jgi:endonuclease YncB( thermonuclease family)
MLIFLAAAVAVVQPGVTFRCTPVRVWDGDGPLWCAEGPRVRLAGIAARESDGSCRRGQPCPAASAAAARDALVGLVGRATGRTRQGHVLVSGPPLSCRSLGNGRGRRTAAWCASPVHGDLSCAMIASGTALIWQRYWTRRSCSRRDRAGSRDLVS